MQGGSSATRRARPDAAPDRAPGSASGSRRWAARRTPSTPTRSSPRSSPTVCRRPAGRPTPTWSSSTRVRSSRRRARSRSTSRSRWATQARRPARGHRLHGRALRQRARRRAARGRRGGRFAGEGSLSEVVLTAASRGLRDLLELPRPAPTAPWAYVKVAEGCDRACAFCAIPSFRGKQRSRSPESIEAEARSLEAGGLGRSCSSRRTSPGTDATSASPARWRRCSAGSTSSRPTASPASACSTCTRRR